MATPANPMLLWTEIAAIAQALGALATAAAVGTSLWIVLSERGAHLKVTAGLRMLIAGDDTPATDFITIRIENHGQRAVRVIGVGWRTGWLRRFGPEYLRHQHALQNPVPSPIFPAAPPFDVAPGQETTVAIPVADYSAAIPKDFGADFFMRRLPFLGLRPANIRVAVSAVAARTSYTTIEASLAHFLAYGVVKNGALEFNKGAEKAAAA
jgi:hypothetical protein